MNNDNHNKEVSGLELGYHRFNEHYHPHHHDNGHDKHYDKDYGHNNKNNQKKRRRMKDGGGEYNDDRVLLLDRLPLEVTWRDILESTCRFHKAQYVSMEKMIQSNYQQAWVTMPNPDYANKLRKETAWPFFSYLSGKDSTSSLNFSAGPVNDHHYPVTSASSTPGSNSNIFYAGVPHPPLPPTNLAPAEPGPDPTIQTKYCNNHHLSKKNESSPSSALAQTETSLAPTKQIKHCNNHHLSKKNDSLASSLSVMADWEQKKDLLEKRESMYEKQLALHKQILQKVKTTQKLKDILNLQTKINALKKEYLQHLQEKPTTTTVHKSNKMSNKNANHYRLDKRTTTLQTTDDTATIQTIQNLLKEKFPQYHNELQIFLSTTKSTSESPQEGNGNESAHDSTNNMKHITCICIKCPNRNIAERIKAKTSWEWYHNPKNIDLNVNNNPKQQQQENSINVPAEEEAVVSIATVLDKQLQQDLNHDNHEYEEEHDEILVDYDDDEE